MRKLAGRLSYANVMATIALFIALGAGAYAAVNLPRNSVKSKHIKNTQVKNKDLRDGAVNAAKLADEAVSTLKLGAGAVTTPKLGDEAVSAAKLGGDVRPIQFDGSLPINSLTDVLLEENGYRIAMACQNDGGTPQIDGSLRVPEDGTLDIQNITSQTGGPSSATAVQVNVAAASAFPFDVSNPPAGEVRTTGVIATYSGATRSALLAIHGVVNDDTDRCSLNGSLVPLTQAE